MAFVDENKEETQTIRVSAYPSTGPPSTFTKISKIVYVPSGTRLLTCLFFLIEFWRIRRWKNSFRSFVFLCMFLLQPAVLSTRPGLPFREGYVIYIIFIIKWDRYLSSVLSYCFSMWLVHSIDSMVSMQNAAKKQSRAISFYFLLSLK